MIFLEDAREYARSQDMGCENCGFCIAAGDAMAILDELCHEVRDSKPGAIDPLEIGAPHLREEA
jgi:hypothetical protein